MNIKNIKINSLISNIEWMFISLFSKVKNKNISISEDEAKIKNRNIYNYEDEFSFLTTEEIYCFLEEGKDFWEQIRINKKINEISIIKEEQYQFLNGKNITKINRL